MKSVREKYREERRERRRHNNWFHCDVRRDQEDEHTVHQKIKLE